MEPRPDEPCSPESSHDGSGERAWSDAWLTFGEAADLGGVPHRTIEEWARNEALFVRRGWREGVEIRLVRAGDLAGLAPGAKERLLDRLRSSERGSLDDRAVFTGPRVSALGRAASGGDGAIREAGELALPVRLPDHASDEDRAWADELEREVRRLRDEVSALRARPGGAARISLRGSEVDVPASSDASAPSAPAGPRSRFVSEDGRGPSFAAPLFVAICALIVGVALGRSLSSSSGQLAHAAVAPANPSPAAELSNPDVPTKGISLGGERTGRTVLPFAALPTAAESAAAESAAAESSTAESSTAESSTADSSTAGSSTVQLTTAEATREPPGAAAVPADISTSGAPAPVPGDEARTIRVPRAPLHLADVDEAPFRSVEGVTSACAYARRIEDSPALLSALGPCFGAPLREAAGGESGVAGTHRVDGVPCCRHHAFVERMTHASSDAQALEGILEEATVARGDGYLPALLRLRAERATRRFLQASLGPWEIAGVDGGPLDRSGDPDLPEHSWRRAEGTPDSALTLELVSWIQLSEPARVDRTGAPETSAPMRAFRLRLRLESGPRGDLLESFQWLDD